MLLTSGVNGIKFIQKMDGLIKMLSAKDIPVKPGRRACTDGKSIFLPWIPEDASESEVIKFMCTALHEQAHFYGKSDIHGASRNKLIHGLQNAVDDIRVERVQEEEYPGIKSYRRVMYKNVWEEFVKTGLVNASKKRMGDFITRLGIYMIIKVRNDELSLGLDVDVNPDLTKAYAKYISDLEERVRSHTDPKESMELGSLIYERLKKLIEEEAAKKRPEPKKPEKPEPEQKEESSEEESGESGGGSEEGSEEEPEQSEESGKSEDNKGDEDESEDGSDTNSEGEQDESPEEQGDSVPDDTEGDTEESEGDSSDGEPGGGDPSEVDPSEQEEYEEAMEERRQEIEREIEEALEDASEEDLDLMRKIAEDVNEIAERAGVPYLTAPGVRDIVADSPAGNLAEATQIRDLGRKILGSERPKLTSLFVSQSRSKHINHQHQGRFDMRSFVSDPLDTRMNIYSDRVGAKLDKVAVSFLLDISGSMRNEVYVKELGREVSRVHMSVMVLSSIMEVLSRASIPVEATSFTACMSVSGEARDRPVVHRRIKTFEEAYGPKVLQRLTVAPIWKSMDQNCEIEAVRYAAPRLFARPEAKKILFILGDGDVAFSLGSLNQRGEKAYKEYLQLCRKAGIYVFGFGIGCNLSKYFGKDCVTDEGGSIGALMLGKLRELLNSPKPRPVV